MARTDYTWESGTVGSQIAAPDSEGAAGVITYDSTANGGRVLHGTKSLKFAPTGTGGTYFRLKSGLAATTVSFNIPVWFDTASTADSYVFSIQDSTQARIVALVRNSVSQFRMYDKTGSSGAQAAWTSTQTAPTGSWVYIKIWVSLGGTATTGSVKLGLYNAAGTLLEPIVSLTTANLGTALIDRVVIGKFDSSNQTAPFWMDTASLDPAGTDLLSTYATSSALAATVSVVPNSGTVPFSVTATAGYSGGTGSPVTYAFNWGDGSTTPAQSGASATHTYNTVGTFTVTATVTNT